MTQRAREVNFDGIVGPTHHFGGLAAGNLASQQHRHQIAHPKQAALQGLQKMKRLADLGLAQAVLPPHDRPDIATLREHGHTGTDAQVVERAHRKDPALLSALSSASAMWAANAATVSPSADTHDGRVHFTPANLASHLHRRIEPPTTAAVLRAAFADPNHFAHHDPIPPTPATGDEGAANHMRLAPQHGAPGIEVFVHGPTDHASSPQRHRSRQTLAASTAIAHQHGLPDAQTLFVQQNPQAINAGAFHNDVVAVANQQVILYHEHAFADPHTDIDRIRTAYADLTAGQLIDIKIPADQLTLEDAVKTYLFNSQIVTPPDADTILICPIECQQHPAARQVIEHILSGDNPIASAQYVDLRQSMQNGGGPACLRLRVVLTDPQVQQMHQGLLLTTDLYQALSAWINQHYRDTLTPNDLGDPQLLKQNRQALDQLTQLLNLGPIYKFQ